ncbi:hypothetical protein ACIRRH_33455 [Kitasatospora sp. NPDC101235]|uniref:hypothetical protein n=1 Tax=Kitasatospora sp. NPDC101235 TaxID=3364101 RepID=UPI00380DA81F
MLAAPGTVRTLLGVNHYELHDERLHGPPASHGMEPAQIRHHLQRLQDARLLAHTGCYDIARQSTTEAARELSHVWATAYLTAQALGLARPDRHVAEAIENVLSLAAAEASPDATRSLPDLPAPHRDLVAHLLSRGAGELAAQLPADTPLRPGQSLYDTPANTALRQLRIMYDALDAWHNHHREPGRAAASTARTRRPAATDPSAELTAPAGKPTARRAPRR